MNVIILAAMIALVRAWTRLYTCCAPPIAREERRAEIESDLWEFQHDQDTVRGPGAALAVLCRLLMGVPDDLAWSVEQSAAGQPGGGHTIALTARGAGAVLFVAAALAIAGDASRRRSGFAFDRPEMPHVEGRLPLLTAGIVAMVGPTMAAAPQFDAASIKPNHTGDLRSSMASQPGGRFVAVNVTLAALIRNAYQLSLFQLVDGPAWINVDRFDVAARAGEDLPPDRMRLLIQTLLAERFALTVHHDLREMGLYALVLARSDGRLGPLLRRSTADCARAPAAPPPPYSNGPPACGFLGPMPGVTLASAQAMMAFRGITIDALSRFLAPAVRRFVVDRTALAGYFDGEFDLTTELGPPPPPPGVANPLEGQSLPSMFTVLPERLGLKLDAGRGPVDVLVVDSAAQPTPD